MNMVKEDGATYSGHHSLRLGDPSWCGAGLGLGWTAGRGSAGRLGRASGGAGPQPYLEKYVIVNCLIFQLLPIKLTLALDRE